MNFVTKIPENVWCILMQSVMLKLAKGNVVEGLVNVRMENVLAVNVLQEIIAKIVGLSKVGVVVNQRLHAGGALADAKKV